YGISTLNPMIHSYSVLRTCHVPVDKPSGGSISPLSTVAVVCNNQLFYSVFGDTDGCDDADFTRETSYALANLCFPGWGLGGEKGYTGHDILYIAFMADDAIPGSNDADWKASESKAFETSLAMLGKN
ncbi:glycoside hydrolase family 75 protein, partial [Piloderma croceum F 1598]